MKNILYIIVALIIIVAGGFWYASSHNSTPNINMNPNFNWSGTYVDSTASTGTANDAPTPGSLTITQNGADYAITSTAGFTSTQPDVVTAKGVMNTSGGLDVFFVSLKSVRPGATSPYKVGDKMFTLSQTGKDNEISVMGADGKSMVMVRR